LGQAERLPVLARQGHEGQFGGERGRQVLRRPRQSLVRRREPFHIISGAGSETNIALIFFCFWENVIFKTYSRNRQSNLPGTDVMILKIFSPKKIAKKLAFLTHNKAKLCKKFDHNIGV
jgi:hypothetical protein